MRTADFDYNLPQELIAFYPLTNREGSRLMVLLRTKRKIGHRRFYELPEFLKKGDVVVLNNTKVIPARLFGKTDAGKEFEVLLEERINPRLWKGIMRNPKHGIMIEFDGGLKGRVLRDGRDRWLVEFDEIADGYIERFGKMPLPPYIRREPEERDRIFYQTIYAKAEAPLLPLRQGFTLRKGFWMKCVKKGWRFNMSHFMWGRERLSPLRPMTSESIVFIPNIEKFLNKLLCLWIEPNEKVEG